MIVGAIEAFVREGFGPTRHDLSLLSNGKIGWVHIGLLVLPVACAVGMRLALRGGGTWGAFAGRPLRVLLERRRDLHRRSDGRLSSWYPAERQHREPGRSPALRKRRDRIPRVDLRLFRLRPPVRGNRRTGMGRVLHDYRRVLLSMKFRSEVRLGGKTATGSPILDEVVEGLGRASGHLYAPRSTATPTATPWRQWAGGSCSRSARRTAIREAPSRERLCYGERPSSPEHVCLAGRRRLPFILRQIYRTGYPR